MAQRAGEGGGRACVNHQQEVVQNGAALKFPTCIDQLESAP